MTKIMATSPVKSWQIDGEEIDMVTDVVFLGLKITPNGDYSSEIETFPSWEESVDKLKHTEEQRAHCPQRGTLPWHLCMDVRAGLLGRLNAKLLSPLDKKKYISN